MHTSYMLLIYDHAAHTQVTKSKQLGEEDAVHI